MKIIDLARSVHEIEVSDEENKKLLEKIKLLEKNKQ